MNKKKAEAVAYGDGCHGGSCRGGTNHTHTALLIVKYNCLVGIPINMYYKTHCVRLFVHCCKVIYY